MSNDDHQIEKGLFQEEEPVFTITGRLTLRSIAVICGFLSNELKRIQEETEKLDE